MSNDLEATESQEQQALISWFSQAANSFGVDSRLLFAIPNGGLRQVATAARLKKEGVRAGIPDLMLAVPKEGTAGLFIELKTLTGKVRRVQNDYHKLLREQGYTCLVAFGWDQARSAIEQYLTLPDAEKKKRIADFICPRCGKMFLKGNGLIKFCLDCLIEAAMRGQKLCLCHICKKIFEAPKNGPRTYLALCSQECKNKYMEIKRAHKYRYIGCREFSRTRKCHDCGSPTFNYRCDACLEAWKQKHNVCDTCEGEL